MSAIKEIIEELKNIHDGNAWHGASLKDALDGITCDQAAARPLKQAHSVWEIVAHITRWEDVFRRRLEGEMIGEPEAGDFPLPAEPSETTWKKTLDDLESAHRELLLAVEKLSDSNMDTNITGKDYSYGFLLRKTIAHKIYHTGQIAFLKNSFL